jgi:hypothetical protein
MYLSKISCQYDLVWTSRQDRIGEPSEWYFLNGVNRKTMFNEDAVVATEVNQLFIRKFY